MATRDLEASTFQKRPAYRYIRATDNMPTLDERDICHCARIKLFNPTGIGTWYISAYDPETRIAYGVADLHEFEYGNIDMTELVAFRGRFNLPIERDLHWMPRLLSECRGT